jgi:hypothetical protein
MKLSLTNVLILAAVVGGGYWAWKKYGKDMMDKM